MEGHVVTLLQQLDVNNAMQQQHTLGVFAATLAASA